MTLVVAGALGLLVLTLAWLRIYVVHLSMAVEIRLVLATSINMLTFTHSSTTTAGTDVTTLH